MGKGACLSKMHVMQFQYQAKTNLIIASSNLGKIKEFRELLSEFPLEVTHQPDGIEVKETGSSFKENARLKALAVSKLSEDWILSDDSGLSVESLNGEPGVHSARYAETDVKRIKKLLENLEPFINRKATFTSALCLACKGTVLIQVEGRCEGVITRNPRGKEGFGYDPIFEVINLGKTYAEIGIEQKKIYGHRGIAFKLLKPELKRLIEFKNID